MLIAMIRRIRGFTLVEMMIVIAILAILMAIGVPSFQTFIQNASIRTAGESMQSGLALARTEALRRNAAVSLWVVTNTTASCARSNTGSSWVVSFTDPAGACANGNSETVAPRIIQTRSGADGSTGVAVSVLSGDVPAGGASCITFTGFGRTQAGCTGGGTPLSRIVFSSAAANTRTLEIRVDSGGGTRLCDPSKTGAAGC